MISKPPIESDAPPKLTGPLKELRLQIQDIHDQLIQPRQPAEEILLGLQHDFRTPIGNILACVTLIHMDGEITESQKELIDIIQESANSLIEKLDALIE